MDYKDEARDLVKGLGQRMSPSPYDIAWLARLRCPNTGDLYWPDLLEWLLENQRPDGSWGGEILYFHDRIICTLIAGIALRENGRRHYERAAVQRAEQYLWRHLHLLARDHFELVGFELIFPTLLSVAQAVGLNIPNHTCGYGKIKSAKLGLIPAGMLYSPGVTIAHSLEFLGEAADAGKLRQAVAANGSLGNSPAATAYYLSLAPHDERALAYLRSAREHLREVIYLYPFSIFELTWVLNNLAFCGAPITEFAGASVWATLRSRMTPAGIGLDPTFGIPDGDITSVVSRLLIKAGCGADPAALARFENKQTGVFRTYDFERNISVGTNTHALETLGLMTDYPNRREAQDNIVAALVAERKYDLYWIDKWHISPYYATAHALVALLQTNCANAALESVCCDTADWLVNTQQADGSWGFFQQGTAEETAYALTALLYCHRRKPVNESVLRRGAACLQRTYRGPYGKYPELWIGKCLYTPLDVVRSAILAALILYEETFGRLPE